MSNLNGEYKIEVEGLVLDLKFTLGAAHRTVEECELNGMIGIAESLQEMSLPVIASLIKNSSDYSEESLSLLEYDLNLVDLITFFGTSIAEKLSPKKKKPAHPKTKKRR